MKRTFLFLGICLLLLLCACGPEQESVVTIPELPAATKAAELTIRDIRTPEATATPTPAPVPTPEPTPEPTPDPLAAIREYVSGMDTDEKIGQLVIFGFSGTSASLPKEFTAVLDEYCVGNICLYGANIARDQNDGGFKKCLKLTDALKDALSTDVEPLIAIDVEGGSVARFSWDFNLLSARNLGKANDTDQAYSQFLTVAESLRGAGINFNLAPVMDVAKKPADTFLDSRIISSDETVVSEIGAACIEGIHDGGCLSAVKHFPGHGATEVNSHDLTPVIRKTLSELESYELVPFQAAIDAGTDCVMVGHLSYPNIDKEYIASQSYYFITELLREDMGFDGLVMSDDFRMKGLQLKAKPKDAAVQFILAGGDLILCGPNHETQKAIMEGLREGVSIGVITEERLDESVCRILLAKEKAGIFNPGR